ncbi:MAG: NAD(P)H-hydrate dehydratase [Bacteroidetes bacterium]|nr:NAD(P)H-hydrate dehydratase [Bacteroidota bacterium]
MKILSVAQTKEADAFTIAHEPVASIDLMERAALSCTVWILKKFGRNFPFRIFCGNGNNGGDGLAIARQLSEQGCDVKVFLLRISKEDAPDFNENLSRLKKSGKTEISVLTDDTIELVNVTEGRIIIDALTGTGFKGEAAGTFAHLIDKMNSFGNAIVSIDIPSGLNGDDNSSSSLKHVVHAKFTLTFQYPKLQFLFSENSSFVGDFHILDIGIHKSFPEQINSSFYFNTKEEIKKNLHTREKFSHKGTFGHALIVAGSKGKMGAAILCARACLRSGAGLVSACVPREGNLIMQTAVPEAMLVEQEGTDFISGKIPVSEFAAIGAGPGLGKAKETETALRQLINSFNGPLVLDADALNIISENKNLLSILPKETILTPHPGEFDRLTQKHKNGFERMKTQKELAAKNGIFIVLKGAYSSIACPDGKVYFNSSGNPGMATGGSGDVLTGIITGLRAQGYSSLESCRIGVYLHGLAGDISASAVTENGVIAGDISENIGRAWKVLVEL